MGGFWRGFGKVFANIGKGALLTAIWASKHPDVIIAVATATGHPKIADAIGKAAPVVNIIESNLPQQ